ncbi:MAG: bifunctional glutamate N-acetyltransferase/amino-acid acetyltransferase ArgJ [Desulfarculales bacterium]|jgi:glutamate N-acetyltransferase/amino-acid N-acetyltransferase|nr:bifunctional glutamate N-acetyltransferase/amino-acid acetyltransferase ArgJ [Desulfarculales bacterium]
MPVFADEVPPSPEKLRAWGLDKGELIDTAVPGFQGAAAAAGLRPDGRVDVGLIAAEQPSPIAGVFTQNKLPAAPVQISRRHLRGKSALAILANSGGANACTGPAGLEACLSTCEHLAQALRCSQELIFPCSTGVIGQLNQLAARINAVIPGLKSRLTPQGLPLAAQAIMTTDAFPKMAQARLNLGGREITVVGMAKGAGMIRPDMATMLAFVLSDVKIDAAGLQKMALRAAQASFNRASVDGDTSTNDTLLFMASGRAANPLLTEEEQARLEAAFTEICQKLAAMIVLDGEGAQHLIVTRIKGAASREQAYQSCYALAHSPLCKTAFYGRDPNWGRFTSTMGALAGRHDYPLEPELMSLYIGPDALVSKGVWQGPEAERRAAAIMGDKIYQLTVDLGLGPHEFWIFTNDLGPDYVRINADYRS